MSRTYLHAYIHVAEEEDGFLPSEPDDRVRILDALLFERAVYDLEYALLHRPDRLGLPMLRLMELMDA
jgi:predicted trehalose synthase